ncbi:hypothetical protein NQ317_007881 [Molorchus minor]|uniref:C2H2-type domain-containing protein n=1 Tax=Molorchus minor TaxID=1323400 RepID=A0ABQ9JTU1_9CUCU|nr:hypothetical protein NQ317_007881 [Molorchus minor]
MYYAFEVYQIVMESITCASCVATLTNYVEFATTCEGTEEIINLYREIQQKEGKIKLSKVLTFLGEDIQYNNDNIKKEGILDNWGYNFKDPGVQEEVEPLDLGVKCKQEQEMAKMGQDQTKYKMFFKRHFLKDIPEFRIFKCEVCEFQTKYRGSLRRHLLGHKNISEVETYKCETCQYLTKHRWSFKRHLLGHKDISEVQTFKCNLCQYQTRQRDSLKNHLLGHKDISEVPIFKCEICVFHTRYRGSLRSHLLTHKDISEVQTCTKPSWISLYAHHLWKY